MSCSELQKTSNLLVSVCFCTSLSGQDLAGGLPQERQQRARGVVSREVNFPFLVFKGVRFQLCAPHKVSWDPFSFSSQFMQDILVEQLAHPTGRGCAEGTKRQIYEIHLCALCFPGPPNEAQTCSCTARMLEEGAEPPCEAAGGSDLTKPQNPRGVQGMGLSQVALGDWESHPSGAPCLGAPLSAPSQCQPRAERWAMAFSDSSEG